jgi:hypothetical protein
MIKAENVTVSEITKPPWHYDKLPLKNSENSFWVEPSETTKIDDQLDSAARFNSSGVLTNPKSDA